MLPCGTVIHLDEVLCIIKFKHQRRLSSFPPKLCINAIDFQQHILQIKQYVLQDIKDTSNTTDSCTKASNNCLDKGKSQLYMLKNVFDQPQMLRPLLILMDLHCSATQHQLLTSNFSSKRAPYNRMGVGVGYR